MKATTMPINHIHQYHIFGVSMLQCCLKRLFKILKILSQYDQMSIGHAELWTAIVYLGYRLVIYGGQ